MCKNYYLFRNEPNQYNMKIIDLHNAKRVEKSPDDVKILLSSGSFVQEEFTISRVELRLYNEKTDAKLGTYSLITSFVLISSTPRCLSMVREMSDRGIS